MHNIFILVVVLFSAILPASDFVTFRKYGRNGNSKVYAVSRFPLKRIHIKSHDSSSTIAEFTTTRENRLIDSYYRLPLRRDITLEWLKENKTEINVYFDEKNAPIASIHFLTSKKEKIFKAKEELREQFHVDYELINNNDRKFFTIIVPLKFPYISVRFDHVEFKINDKTRYAAYFLDRSIVNPIHRIRKFDRFENGTRFDINFARNRHDEHAHKLGVDYIQPSNGEDLVPNHINFWQTEPNHVLLAVNKEQLRDVSSQRSLGSITHSKRSPNEVAGVLKEIRKKQLSEEDDDLFDSLDNSSSNNNDSDGGDNDDDHHIMTPPMPNDIFIDSHNDSEIGFIDNINDEISNNNIEQINDYYDDFFQDPQLIALSLFAEIHDPQKENEEIVSLIEKIKPYHDILVDKQKAAIDYKYAHHSYYSEIAYRLKQERIENAINKWINSTHLDLKEVVNLLIFRIMNAVNNPEFNNNELILSWIKDLFDNYYLQLSAAQKSMIKYQKVFLTDNVLKSRNLSEDNYINKMYYLTKDTIESLKRYQNTDKDCVSESQWGALFYKLSYFMGKHLGKNGHESNRKLKAYAEAYRYRAYLSEVQCGNLFFEQMYVGSFYYKDSETKLKLAKDAANYLKDHPNAFTDKQKVQISYQLAYHTAFLENKSPKEIYGLIVRAKELSNRLNYALNNNQINKLNELEEKWKNKTNVENTSSVKKKNYKKPRRSNEK